MSEISPYYADGLVTVFLGDARDILPTLSGYGAILADPPYGINYQPAYGKRVMPDGSIMWPTKQTVCRGDDQPFDPRWLLDCAGRAGATSVLLWGANNYADKLPAGGRWLVWDKRCDVIPQRTQGDCELAWVNTPGVIRKFSHIWDGLARDSERNIKRVHPMQKPIDLMAWCLGFCAEGVVVDPFAGSGTTGVACVRYGRKCILIESDPAHAASIVQRVREAHEGLSLITRPPDAYIQPPLFVEVSADE